MKTRSGIQIQGLHRERGAAMVIALVMLLVLTLLATASARMTLMEERMTGNTQDRNIAFQVAEAGLRGGESQAQLPVLPDFSVNQQGLYTPAAPGAAAVWEAIDWTDAADVLTHETADDVPALLDDAPGVLADASVSFVVEQLPRVATPGESLAADTSVDEATFYRVTSRGVGVSGNATVTLQTTFKR
ncbi:MAG: PilX N-terminal domain-containing pilus assembly protein [Gammaproteobacteria bacterium]|nr:PilX N-terminal domain-containing pilus assembly protein [Gammaproteobacteria bacterium]